MVFEGARRADENAHDANVCKETHFVVLVDGGDVGVFPLSSARLPATNNNLLSTSHVNSLYKWTVNFLKFLKPKGKFVTNREKFYLLVHRQAFLIRFLNLCRLTRLHHFLAVLQ